MATISQFESTDRKPMWGMSHTAAFYFIEFNTALTTSLAKARLSFTLGGPWILLSEKP